MSKYLDSTGLETLWDLIKSAFASSLSIDDRTISLKNKNGDTLGSTITIPSTATSLATAGTIQIDLASTSSVTYTSGGNITPGVKNALKVANGGTGKSSLDSGKALIGNGTNAVTLRNIYTRTESGNLEWTSGTNEYLLTKGAIAYWNGAYGTTGKSNITTLGTITTGVWNGTAIDVAYGGTGIASNPSMLVNLASTTADTVFETSPRPGVTGTLGIGNGGTGLTASPSMLTNLGSTSTANVLQASPRPGVTGTLGVGNGGTGQTTAKDASNAFINALDTETTALQDGDYFIAQTAGGGTTTTTYKRKALSTLSDYIEDKIDGTYLPLAGGQMTGTLTWKNGTALPAKTSDINYLLTIDSFSDGGATKYATMANVANAITPTVETAVENDYIMLTKKSDMVIPANSDLNDYTQPGFYICPQNSYAKTVSNVPQADPSTTEPFPWAFSLEIQPTVMSPSYTISGVRQILRRYASPTQNNEMNTHPATWERDYYSSWGEWRRTSSIIYNPYTNNRRTSLDFPNAENGMGAMFHTVASGTKTTGKPFSDANLLQMNWDTASGYDSQLAIGTHGKWLGFRGQSAGTWCNWNYVQSINFGICETASATTAKAVTMNNPCSGIDGMEMDILFVNGDTSGAPTITVNIPGGTMGTNIALLYKGKPVEPTYIKAGDIIKVVYHNDKWNVVGCINSVTSYGNHIRYYIHRTDGSDTNDGLTTNTPFKTIEKFLEVTANAGYTDCRCTILKDGSYVLNKQALNNVTLHIKVDDSVNGNVILQGNYNVPEDWIMYNAHVKLTGTANAPIVYEPYSTNGIYFENSAVTLDYVKFNCRMQCFGCYVKADNITAERLHLSGCTGYLATVSITNTDHEQHGIVLDRGCNMRISGSFTINALTEAIPSGTTYQDKNYFFNIQDSDIVLQSSFPTTLVNGSSTIDITNDTNRTRYSYAYGMRLSNAEITGTRIRLASYVSRGVNKTMLADEESDINVTWGGKKTGGESDGRAGFTSLYGYETVTFKTPASEVSATSIKTWIIAKSTIDAAVQAAHPNVGTSSYPYDVIAVVPISTSDNKIVFKDTEYIPTSDATNPGAIRVIVRNVTSTAIPAPSSTNPGATATVNVIYTMKPFSVTYKS